MTLFSGSRGTHLLFIALRPDYLFCCAWVASSLHNEPVTFPAWAGTHLILLGGVEQMGVNLSALPKCTTRITYFWPCAVFDLGTFGAPSEHSTTESRCLSSLITLYEKSLGVLPSKLVYVQTVVVNLSYPFMC